MIGLVGKLLLVAALSLESGLYAATSGTGQVSLNIQPIDSFSVSDGGTLILDGSAGNNVLAGGTDNTALGNYSHNGPNDKKIVVEVKAADNPPNHDITLSVTVGANTRTLVSNGSAQTASEVVSALPPGNYRDRTVSYDARCTASGTSVAADTDFVFVVTFTTTD